MKGLSTAAVFLLLIHLASVPTFAQEGFRQAKWGTDRNEVLNRHGGPVKQGEIKGMPSVVYEARTAGREALAIFYFLPDSLKLAAGEYAFVVSHENPAGYVQDYNDVASAVSDLYGTPMHDKAEWRSQKYKSKYDNHANAIDDGNLDLTHRWKTPEGIIVHKLSDTKPGGHTLLYIGTQYAPTFLAIQTAQKYKGL